MFALFVDTQNLHNNVQAQFSGRLNYADYVSVLEQKLGFGIPYKHAYGCKDYGTANKFITMLRSVGFTTTFEEHGQWSVAIAIAAMSLTPNVTTVILGSSDISLVPLIKYLKLRGLNVIVSACNVPRVIKALAECVDISESQILKVNNEAAKPLELSPDGVCESV